VQSPSTRMLRSVPRRGRQAASAPPRPTAPRRAAAAPLPPPLSRSLSYCHRAPLPTMACAGCAAMLAPSPAPQGSPGLLRALLSGSCRQHAQPAVAVARAATRATRIRTAAQRFARAPLQAVQHAPLRASLLRGPAWSRHMRLHMDSLARSDSWHACSLPCAH
jgi:hypothetical protein